VPNFAAGKDAKASGVRDMTRLCAEIPTAIIDIPFSLRSDNTPVIHTSEGDEKEKRLRIMRIWRYEEIFVSLCNP
jgi:hypothetical protein